MWRVIQGKISYTRRFFVAMNIHLTSRSLTSHLLNTSQFVNLTSSIQSTSKLLNSTFTQLHFFSASNSVNVAHVQPNILATRKSLNLTSSQPRLSQPHIHLSSHPSSSNLLNLIYSVKLKYSLNLSSSHL